MQSLHPPFDIHSCGQEIVDKLQQGTNSEEAVEPVTFHRVVRGKTNFEVCRMFLASLQLANNGNVELHHGKGSDEQINTPFSLHLLDAENRYAGIQNIED